MSTPRIKPEFAPNLHPLGAGAIDFFLAASLYQARKISFSAAADLAGLSLVRPYRYLESVFRDAPNPRSRLEFLCPTVGGLLGAIPWREHGVVDAIEGLVVAQPKLELLPPTAVISGTINVP